MIDPTDKRTKDLFELMAQEVKYAEELCGMRSDFIIAMDFSEAEQRAMYAITRRLIDLPKGTNTGRISSSTPNQIYGKSISQIFMDECVEDIPYAAEPALTKDKKAQWKNERSVFNRVNQGKKSK